MVPFGEGRTVTQLRPFLVGAGGGVASEEDTNTRYKSEKMDNYLSSLPAQTPCPVLTGSSLEPA